MVRSIIIVAGGKGLRMGGEIPKQFMLIGGRPILMHTIEAFKKADDSIRIIVVLPRSQKKYWNFLCEQYHFTIEHSVVNGGDTRFQSVKNGLTLASSEGVIGIHDGVRPFVSIDVILRCFDEAGKKEAVVPVIDMVDSIREINSNTTNRAVDRNMYKIVQTPQVFEASLLHRAYEQSYTSRFTDDASVVEAFGSAIFFTEGNKENIKITTPFDVLIANALLKCRI